MFRIVQSIPSPKAEPLKRWLAKVGYERVQEIEDPELATKRTRMFYKLKGYSENWIEKRMRGIAIREELTDEWQKRGVKEQKEYEILTAEISKATFGVTPSEYKKLKGLKRQNLRDHMDDLELIFNMLGERVTTEISQQEKPDTFVKNKKVAERGGNVAGNARKETEKEIGPERDFQGKLPALPAGRVCKFRKAENGLKQKNRYGNERNFTEYYRQFLTGQIHPVFSRKKPFLRSAAGIIHPL